MLTATQRKRLAKEARKLAMEVVDGRSVVGRWYTAGDGPACPLGQLSSRIAVGLDEMLDDDTVDSYDVVFAHSIFGRPSDEFSFALLSFADALEEA